MAIRGGPGRASRQGVRSGAAGGVARQGPRQFWRRPVNLWHESFYACVAERAPPGFDILTEVSLSRQPRRVDLLVLRRKHEPDRDDEAGILRGLWRHMRDVTLVEFKSPTRGLRRSDLLRLFGYGLQYHEQNMDRCGHRSKLGLALVIPGPSRALAGDLAAMDCRLQFMGNGYARVHGFVYDTIIVFTNEVSQSEQDDFLRIFSQHPVQTVQARHWLEQWLTEKSTMPSASKQAGHDEILAKLIRSMPLEERLAGLRAEERLAGLDLADMFLALPVEMLRGFSDEYIATLPANARQTIRKRLRHARSPRRRTRRAH